MPYFLIFLTVFMHLALPLLFIFWLYVAKPDGKLFLFSLVLLIVGYLGFMWPLGAGWGWVSVYWPPVLTGLFIVVLGLKIKKGLPQNWFPKRWSGPFFGTGINLVLAALFFYSSLNFFIARDYEGDAMALTFPLTGGTFFIGHGGANESVNYHFPVKAQRYALDISKLNAFGTRAAGLLPESPQSYQIFGNDVVAPCTGEVIGARSDLEDQNAFVFDPENLEGNHLILYCSGNSVLLAHLKHDSVLVKVGDMVSAGQLIAQVGNTGNTSEPHLHIHSVKGRYAERDDVAFDQEGVPMTFGGKFLIRNDKIKN